ncbi:MAG: nucleoside kinase [Bacilli bacterium]|nr:nucleoside kinase [Bacilli bacterium]
MEFKVKFEGQELVCSKKTSLLSLIGSDRKDVICALVNNRLRELTYEVYYDAEIQFLTTKDQQAIRTYETSLRYLLAMAINRVEPSAQFRFSYNISRSIFIEILSDGIRVDSTLVKKIKEEMDKIIKADLPFTRKIVSNEEAQKLFEEKGFQDKSAILKYRPEKTVHLYECDGYLNYMYGHMVPSSGYLHDYRIRLYAPGIIVQYPRSECKGEIPDFKDAPMFGRTLKASHKWSKAIGADSIAGINDYIKNNNIVDFINLCEAKHTDMLCELGNIIETNIDDIRLICIAGPSSSGKTTFANRLRTELLGRGLKPIRISLDDYYLSRAEAPKDEDGNPDLESIYALDIEQFNKDMSGLINGEEIQLPKFDFNSGKRVPGRTLKIGPNEPIIIEGIHALNDTMTPSIPRHQKFKIFIAPQAQINLDNHNPISLTDLRLLRRLVRDKKFRNAPAELTFSMWPSVRRGEFTWIYDTQEGADFVFNSLLSYELCVMKKYALPLLQAIDKESEYFTLAERLIKFLKYFSDMDEEWIPCNSLIREFIGGSCYQDV